MRILFLTPSYLDLYKDIENELISEGHNVCTVILERIPQNPFYKLYNPIKRLYLRRQWDGKKYWQDKLLKPEFNSYYDLLFVIQGLTFDPIILEHLRMYNKNIKSSLYIWDTNRMYDFFHNVKYFDKAYSFDYEDVRLYGNNRVGFLPFFWSKELLKYQDCKIKYKISSIGTNHHGRLTIYKKVIEQLKLKNEAYYIKLIIPQIDNILSIKDKCCLYICKKLGIKESYTDNLLLISDKTRYDFIEHSYYSTEQLNIIMSESESVLDTDNEMQHGTTPRLIWALALNKHVFTTNSNIKQLPFYDSRWIHIIDRNNPSIDFSFSKNSVGSQKSVEYLRIDNWLKNFL